MRIKRKDHFPRLIGISISSLLFVIIGSKEVLARPSDLSTLDCVSVIQNLLDKAKQGNAWKQANDTFVQGECRQYSELILSADSLFNDVENTRSLKRANDFRLQDPHTYKPSDRQYPLWNLVGAFLHAAPKGPAFNLEKSREDLVKLLVLNSLYKKTYPPVWKLAKIALQDLESRGSLSPATISISAVVFKGWETEWMLIHVWNVQTIRNMSRQRDCSWWSMGKNLAEESRWSLIMIFLSSLSFILLEDHVRSRFTSKVFGCLITKIDQIKQGMGTKYKFSIKEGFYVFTIVLISIANYFLSFNVSNDIFSLTGSSINSDCQITLIGLWVFIVMIVVLAPWIYIGMEWLKTRKNMPDRKMYRTVVAMILSMPPLSILLPIAVIANAKGVSIDDAIRFGSVLKDSFMVFVSILWAIFVEKALFD